MSFHAMLALLSPAKSLDFDSPLPTRRFTQPRFTSDSAELVALLRKHSSGELGKLMSISEKLAALNHARFAAWKAEFTPENSRPALFAFTGDVYQGLDLQAWKSPDFTAAQKQIRIFSGLYGLLRPLDLLQPYRLEMGTKLASQRGKNLYEFWGGAITEAINRDLKQSGSTYLVNLASNEYFSAVRPADLRGQLVTPVFKDEKNGTYKVISFYAKKARGMMADFIVRNRIADPAGLKKFQTAGYRFSKADSGSSTLVFLRPEVKKHA